MICLVVPMNTHQMLLRLLLLCVVLANLLYLAVILEFLFVGIYFHSLYFIGLKKNAYRRIKLNVR